MDELTARFQRAATELAERAVVPDPDDIVRRGRRQRRRHAAGAVLLAMALAGGVVAVPLLRPWQPRAPTGMPPVTPSTSTLAPGHRCPARTTAARLTAKDIAFDPACLTAEAGRPFTLKFNNKEAVLHNVSIFEGTTPTARSPSKARPSAAPGSSTYQVPAPPTGQALLSLRCPPKRDAGPAHRQVMRAACSCSLHELDGHAQAACRGRPS